MSAIKVDAFAVTIYGNIAGWYPDGITIALDCTATKIEKQVINPAVGGANCRYAAGMIWNSGAPQGVATVDTIKMSTETDGFVWVKESDYNLFVTHCNSCCIS